MFEKNVMLFSNIKRTASIIAKINDIDSAMVYVNKFLGVLIYIYRSSLLERPYQDDNI